MCKCAGLVRCVRVYVCVILYTKNDINKCRYRYTVDTLNVVLQPDFESTKYFYSNAEVKTGLFSSQETPTRHFWGTSFAGSVRTAAD